MVTERSGRGNVLVGKCSVGEVSVGEASGRRIVCSEKCPSGKCPSGKCQSGMCPRGSASRGCVLGEVSLAEISSRGNVRIPSTPIHAYFSFAGLLNVLKMICSAANKKVLSQLAGPMIFKFLNFPRPCSVRSRRDAAKMYR